jgi:hypothetical protein
VHALPLAPHWLAVAGATQVDPAQQPFGQLAAQPLHAPPTQASPCGQPPGHEPKPSGPGEPSIATTSDEASGRGTESWNPQMSAQPTTISASVMSAASARETPSLRGSFTYPSVSS